ncbi:DUF3592 domain-containing protein [Zavarzinia compransoris]|uniref:DUF3592 domain-containing protein n=1 Tax=Zavarzinia marina TaxID=2911065 RepID=UPI001F178713|nr:DUF3592 domain-containing protein [Zavarzinia marina]MCF4165498.1 DUF3592 domain-containing protein [Zavarzinia marina]
MIRLLGFLLLVAGGIFTWLGAEDGIATWKRVARAEDVIAELVRFDPAPGGQGAIPIAAFVGEDGQRHEAALPPVSRPDAAIGTPVHLLHPPGRPDLAETGDLIAIWAPSAVPVGGGILGAVIGLAMLTSRRRRPEDMPRVPFVLRFGLFAVAFGLIAVAWTEYETVVDSLNQYPRTRGTVVAVDQGGAATIRFTAADGTPIEYEDRSLPPGSFSPGERVTLGYSKSNPEGARVETFAEVWSVPAAWGSAAGVALLVALFAASLRRGKEKPAPREAGATFTLEEEAPPAETGDAWMADPATPDPATANPATANPWALEPAATGPEARKVDVPKVEPSEAEAPEAEAPETEPPKAEPPVEKPRPRSLMAALAAKPAPRGKGERMEPPPLSVGKDRG